MTPLSAEIEALRGAYAALNRGDVAGFVRVLDAQIERVEPPGFPMSGTYRGLDAVSAHFTEARGAWAEGACEPERFTVVGGRVVVIVRVRVRLRDETAWREGRVADGFAFRDGKAVVFRTFLDEREALEWAGA